MNLKKHFSKFLKFHAGKLHLSAHSHHFWPDCTEKAMRDYFYDSAKYSDKKWEVIFQKMQELQKFISQAINLKRPERLCFAPNTHELLTRVFSCFEGHIKPVKILTTDSEFNSFERQARRWEEVGQARVTRVPSLPIENFPQRLKEAAKKSEYDIIYFSHVFYNHGQMVNLDETFKDFPFKKAQVMVDGYHSYFTRPLDLSNFENDIFFLSGSYKYAMGGEGLCFMTVPDRFTLNPVNTGWFSEFSEIEKNKNENVAFPVGAERFRGSTIDYTALYRCLSVFKWMQEINLTLEGIHRHVRELQVEFLRTIDQSSFLKKEK